MARLLVTSAVAPPPPEETAVQRLQSCSSKVEAEAGSIWLLKHAVLEGQLEDVTRLLQSRANIEARDDYNMTPLFWAAMEGHREIVDLLLEQKAEIEARDCICGATPLLEAVRGGHREVVQILLEKHAEIHATDRYGLTPLARAVVERHIEIVTLLLEKRANPNLSRGWPELPEAIDRGDSEVVEALAAGMVEHSLWSVSVLVEIFSSDNSDMLVKALEMWPQDATQPQDDQDARQEKVQRASLPERLRTVLSHESHDSRYLCDSGAWFVSEQNLFWVQEVAVTWKHLPGVCGTDAIDNRFLQSLVESPHDAIFETDAVQAMILAAWQQYRAFTFLEIAWSFLTVVCLCCSSYGFPQGFAFATPCLYVIAAKKTLDELYQLLQHCVKSAADKGSYINFDNAADVLYIVTGWLALVRQLSADPRDLEKPWMAVFSALSWLKLLYSLRGETWMGPRLLPILSAIKDTFAFFLLMTICLAAATHAYYNLQFRQEPVPTYAAVMQVVRLGIFGDFDLFEFEGLDPTYKLKDDGNKQEWEPNDPSPGPDYLWVHALFYITGVGITVLLMNVLIGVLSSNYERYEDQAIGQFCRARVKMLVELQGRPIGLLFEHLVESLPYSGSGGSFYLEKLFAVSISPFTCALMLDQGEKESLLRNFRWTHKYVKVVISLCSPVVFAMSLSFAIVLLFCRACFYPIGFRYSGMRYTILCSLDVFNGNAASICKIFFVVREEPDINDVRSIRTELKRYIDVMQEKMEQKLESKIQKVESKIEKGFAQMHELIAGLNQRTQEVPAMDEESEGLEPPHGNISPQDVEIEAAIEPSEEVSHTEEVEEVTKSTPKTKKKAKRQTKRSAVTT